MKKRSLQDRMHALGLTPSGEAVPEPTISDRDLSRLRQRGLLSGKPRAVTEPTAAEAPRPSANSALPGAAREGPEGSLWWVEQRFPLTHQHGDLALGEALSSPQDSLGVVGCTQGLASIAPIERIYFDTETTSLECGAGVHVFLLGVGCFESDAFVVRQLLMRDPGEERAMLRAFQDLTANKRALVSYCGKSFDVPRTRDRFLYQALGERFGEFVHLDLYHAARRLFRHRFDALRLQTLEAGLLGFQRRDDLPGAECPAQWFALQRGQPHRLAEVLRHNLEDVLSLVVLEARLARTLDPDEDDPVARLVAATLSAEADPTDARRQRLGGLASDLWGRIEDLSPSWALRVAKLARSDPQFDLNAWLRRAHRAWPWHRGVLTALLVHLEWQRQAPSEALDILRQSGAESPALARRKARLQRKLVPSASACRRGSIAKSPGPGR